MIMYFDFATTVQNLLINSVVEKKLDSIISHNIIGSRQNSNIKNSPQFATAWPDPKFYYNPFMHNLAKWPNILLKSCGVNTPRFLKYVWEFYNIMHQRDKISIKDYNY